LRSLLVELAGGSGIQWKDVSSEVEYEMTAIWFSEYGEDWLRQKLESQTLGYIPQNPLIPLNFRDTNFQALACRSTLIPDWGMSRTTGIRMNEVDSAAGVHDDAKCM